MIGFYALSYLSKGRAAIAWLVLMSCVFYSWFRIDYLFLLIALIVFNYLFGVALSNSYKKNRQYPILLFCGIAVNLLVLFYFKYINFALTNANTLFGTNFVLYNIIMPIGISFFIFQKIAYLVDAYRGEAEEYNFLDFCLFVLYFPQLIAGPIVHHKELIPQFRQKSVFKFNPTDVSVGLIMFTIGLGKKVLIADQLALWIDAPFKAVESAMSLSFIEAWSAALTFALQIYFDFSAYTDMALGMALMMGIRLPLNFDSPYKATNIIDFWRRWHMTLSRFLRDYVYIPSGGNRKGSARRYFNLFITMLIGGIWHGAAWTFVFWGALHGFYLICNHLWRNFKTLLGLTSSTWITRITAQFFTFLAVLVAWVFFRAQNFKAAINMLKGMLGFNGVTLAAHYETTLGNLGILFKKLGIHFVNVDTFYFSLTQLLYLVMFYCVVWFLPNTQQICAYFRPSLQSSNAPINSWWRFLPFITSQGNSLQIRLSPVLGIILPLSLLAILIWQTLRATPLVKFIYFQF